MQPLSRFRRLLAATAASGMFLLAAGLIACLYFNIWSYSDFLEYRETHKYALGSKLWAGQIAADQDIEELIAEFLPHRLHRFGRWMSINYFPNGPTIPGYLHFESLTVTAKDGKIVGVQVGSCTASRTFIRLSTEENEECTRTFQRYCEEGACKDKAANQ